MRSSEEQSEESDVKVASGRDGAEPTPAVTRVPGWAYPGLTLASLLMGATNLVRGTSALHGIEDSDLTNFFFKSATYILNGDPWHMYAVRASGAYPNYNPPLSMFLMAPLLGLARALASQLRRADHLCLAALPRADPDPGLRHAVGVAPPLS